MVSSVKLAELWQRIGYRVIVVCMGTSVQSGKMKDERGKCRVSVEHVSETLEIHRLGDYFLPDPWNYGIAFGFSGYVRRLVKDVKPDLIVVNKLLFWSSLAALVLRLRGHHVIVLTDALVGMTWWPRGWLPRLCSRIYAWTLGWLILRCADRVVFFHPQPERLLRFLGIKEKSQVIPTGIDIRNHESRIMNHEKNIVVTYVGRLESVKGVDDFLAAAEQIIKKFSHVQFQVVGWYESSNVLVQKYGSIVTFTGLRDDIPKILTSTDIFVLPSYSEGLSNALMEAMSSGCACIASDVGGNRFLIQNGVSGLLFPVADREALVSHMRRLIEDPAKRRTLGQAARTRIEEEFDWKMVGKMYEKLLEEHLKNCEVRIAKCEGISNSLPRVVILSTFLTPFRSGAEACAEEVARQLSRKFDITIITARLQKDLPVHDVLDGKVKIRRIGSGFGFDKWLFPFLAPFAARRLQPQIIHGILDRKSTRLNSSHSDRSRMPSSA